MLNLAMNENPSSTIDGIAKELSKFPCVSYLDDVQLSDGLLEGSIASAAVIACSDMGWQVPYVCSAANVQLFLFQDFGHHHTNGGFNETLVESGIANVVVYGHSVCAYTRFLAKSARDNQNGDFLQSVATNHQLQLCLDALESDNETLWEKVGQFNVLQELKGMLADPVIAPLAARGKLRLHGWFYTSANRQLHVFDPANEAFTAVKRTERPELPDSLALNFVTDRSHIPED